MQYFVQDLLKIGDKVTHYAKTERQTIVLTMISSGILSSFLSNTGTAAIFIPIIVGISKVQDILVLDY